MHKEDLTYNGVAVDWQGHGIFKASSGLPGHRLANEQSNSNEGPIPEGLFSFPLTIAKDATMIGRGQLDRREGVEHIPDAFEFGGARYANQAWGPDRVRLTVEHINDPKNRKRAGFYLHDSRKGYSHGCVEVERRFFLRLREFIGTRGHRSRLYLRVKYSSASTYGRTDTP